MNLHSYVFSTLRTRRPDTKILCFEYSFRRNKELIFNGTIEYLGATDVFICLVIDRSV